MSKRTITFIVLIFIAIGLFTVAIYLLYQDSPVQVSDNTISVKEETPVMTEANNYNNDELGIAIDLIPNHEIIEYPFRNNTEIKFYNITEVAAGDPTFGDPKLVPSVATIAITKFSKYENSKEKYLDGNKCSSTKIIGGVEACVVTEVVNTETKIDRRVIFKDGYVYDIFNDRFRFGETADPKQIELGFETILAAIKFKTPVANTRQVALKTYQSTDNLYSFDYPADWSVKTNDAGEVEVMSFRNKKAQEASLRHAPYIEGAPFTNLVIGRFESLSGEPNRWGTWEGMKDSYSSWKELLDDKNGCEQITGQTTLDEMPAYEISLCGLSGSFGVVAENKNKFYLLEFPASATKQDLLPEELAILKSFKFTK